MLSLEQMYKELRVAKNRKTFGLSYTNTLVRIVKANPEFVLNELMGAVTYYLETINELESEK